MSWQGLAKHAAVMVLKYAGAALADEVGQRLVESYEKDKAKIEQDGPVIDLSNVITIRNKNSQKLKLN